jgi:hypothetical protein
MDFIAALAPMRSALDAVRAVYTHDYAHLSDAEAVGRLRADIEDSCLVQGLGAADQLINAILARAESPAAHREHLLELLSALTVLEELPLPADSARD